MIDDSNELIREFLIESLENLDRLDRELLVLEKNPSHLDSVKGIFRTIHTIKGTCGFLGFGKLEAVAHVGESLLSRLRDGELTVSQPIMTGLLEMVDAIRGMLDHIERSGNEGGQDHGVLIGTLTALHDGPGDSAPVANAPAPAPDLQAAPAASEPAAAGNRPVISDDGHGHGVADAYVRVDVELLDRLMNLVGELVLARNQILQLAPTIQEQTFTTTCQRLNLITSELQSSVMKTRMQPIGNVWDKLPRLVRDLALLCKKEVRIEMEGKDTELDKTIIEAIRGPLTHLVRNCIDHGLELPEQRRRTGKSGEGRLLLRAFHEGGQVNIEVSDDGAGLDLGRIRDKAIERGLLTIEQAHRLPERELSNLIFLPGFSTAKAVSNISGRGVGMDVVKTSIENLGGVVDLVTRPGLGTTFHIKIPLTLAIVPALIVTSGGDRFAIPQVSLLELVHLDDEQARGRIENIQGTPVYRLRGALLPLVDLRAQLCGEPRLDGDGAGVNIVVVQADQHRFGLVVDEVNDTEEIVVKPLGQMLKGLNVFAGATIMGDGAVALILDIPGLAQRAGLKKLLATRSLTAKVATPTAPRARQNLLLFETGNGNRVAIPLSMVARLETFPRRMIEHVGGRHVVQYRGDVLPILDVAVMLGYGAAADDDNVPVVVFSESGENGQRKIAGLAVGRILDIVDIDLDIKSLGGPGAPGVVGCAIIHQQVTELLDLRLLLQGAGSDLLSQASPSRSAFLGQA